MQTVSRNSQLLLSAQAKFVLSLCLLIHRRKHDSPQHGHDPPSFPSEPLRPFTQVMTTLHRPWHARVLRTEEQSLCVRQETKVFSLFMELLCILKH